jgi:hypothetical protein
MKLIELSVILEIATHSKSNDAQQFERAIADLKQAKIAGCSVALVVHDSGRNAGTVPCVGYDVHRHTQRSDLMPSSVKRYFGVRVFSFSVPRQPALGQYRLNRETQIQLCGMSGVQPPGERELTRMEEDCHAA